MASRLSARDEELQRRTDEVLHYIWDPIGISTIPEARQEYSGYVMQVLGLLKSKATAEQIASRLTEIATQRMELTADPKHDLETAECLVQWREALDEGA